MLIHRLHVKSAILLSVAGVLSFAPLAPVVADAASVTPTKSMLTKNKAYYKKHAKTLIKKYKLDRSSMTAISKNGTARVYVKNGSSELRSSLKMAIQYWNQKLGKNVLKMGTKKNHTLTFSVSKQKATASDESDAWWAPDTKQMQVRYSFYVNTPSDAATQILQNSMKTKITDANAKIATYRQSLDPNDPQIETKVAAYRKQVIAQVQSDLTAEKNDIAANKLGYKARKFEYANTLTHEFGHALGLNHSPNKNDAMYYASETPAIFDYSKLKASTNGFNPLTKTDVYRAKLSLKIFQALK
ncbi:matrixin family metalloprotease [Lentilactobacillus sp. Marseille-Q4993]|uniref:matrixin family metalloprotease n=1 Tax=Lentilactobacillus sp. Marseille-Q4993 TaxID=3039492 RepID=UPI0024BD5822|nr:matrixin family metalloprotease [Lentilactobacillus sp. Marseille-Q4993]